ncbi:hypothetical protein DXG01_008439 [Tephrocybe rancida]|nr:hypothetical protein DXG01_008439 [Tephrocybe rancida]
MIHVANGLEFGVPGLVAEGLAWAAVHVTSSSAVLTLRFRQTCLHLSYNTPLFGSRTGLSARSLLERKNPRVDAILEQALWSAVYSDVETNHGDAIAEYVRTWTIDRRETGKLERKIEELIYVKIYAICAWSNDKDFKASFYHVHLVTSAMFLSSIAVVIPISQELLLRSYFAGCLTWWIGRGQPGFVIAAFYAGTSINPGLVNQTVRRKDALPTADSPKAHSLDVWFPARPRGVGSSR